MLFLCRPERHIQSPTSPCEKDKLWRGANLAGGEANPLSLVLNSSDLPLRHSDLLDADIDDAFQFYRIQKVGVA